MVEPSNVLTFNDKSYSSDDLTKWTDRQKYLASQIQELQQQRAERSRALDQTVGSIEFFTQQLIASLQEVTDGSDQGN
jgi:chromosome segregation and condensation protein ScpB